ncbi:MAG: hypothetical protein HOW73_35925, partial [Polyangiaceae bacterium]|nr:hypothetical protein [Polyangiaceae bacterium]
LLRYLAVIDPSAHRPLRVGPEEVEPSHPAAALRGTEAMVSLTTERCGDVPVVVRGPGAGGAVTASGVLADILRALGDAGASGRPSFRGREPRTTFEGQYLR